MQIVDRAVAHFAKIRNDTDQTDQSENEDGRNSVNRDNPKDPSVPPVASRASRGCTASLRTEDLEAGYKLIVDDLAKQQLPPELKFNGSKAVITSTVRDTATVISTSAKYVETSFKILSNIQSALCVPGCEGCEPTNQVEDLWITLYAHMRYLQEHFATLAVIHYGIKFHFLIF